MNRVCLVISAAIAIGGAFGAAAVEPIARNQPSFAWDATRERGLLFGGIANRERLADTWILDDVAWSRVDAKGPSVRVAHRMVFDVARKMVVLFGGLGDDRERLADTWLWDGVNWSEADLSKAPAARSSHAMAFDAKRGQVVLFGGRGSEGTLGDTWLWDGEMWRDAGVEGPEARRHHAMAWDAKRGHVVLFGGNGDYGRLDDTWLWDGTAWVRSPSTGPTGRDHHAMAFDARRGVVVVYGGWAGEILGDLWEWDGTVWSEADASPVPPRAGQPGLVWDTARERLLLYGGRNSGGDLRDLWSRGEKGWKSLRD